MRSALGFMNPGSGLTSGRPGSRRESALPRPARRPQASTAVVVLMHATLSRSACRQAPPRRGGISRVRSGETRTPPPLVRTRSRGRVTAGSRPPGALRHCWRVTVRQRHRCHLEAPPHRAWPVAAGRRWKHASIQSDICHGITRDFQRVVIASMMSTPKRHASCESAGRAPRRRALTNRYVAASSLTASRGLTGSQSVGTWRRRPRSSVMRRIPLERRQAPPRSCPQ